MTDEKTTNPLPRSRLTREATHILCVDDEKGVTDVVKYHLM